MNISSNSTSTAFGVSYSGGVTTALTNNPKLKRLATPTTFKDSRCLKYRGSLVVQSAGNHNVDACEPLNTTDSGIVSPAYIRFESGQRYYADGQHIPPLVAGAPSSLPVNDGIVVVGALRENGLRASQYTTGSGAVAYPWTPSVPSVSQYPRGTNYGRCVDVFAPGDRILSTWGAFPGNSIAGVSPPYQGNPATIPLPIDVFNPPVVNTNGGWAYMSGTSMAAPHIAGAAALLAGNSIIWSTDTEGRLRARFVALPDPLTGPQAITNHVVLP